MVAEAFSLNQNGDELEPPPFILGLQPSALVDNVAHVDWSLLDRIPGEPGGSIPVCIHSFYYLVILRSSDLLNFIYVLRLQLKSLKIY